jgi:hypothetical protein
MLDDRTAQDANAAWFGLVRDIARRGVESRPRGLLIKELLAHTTKADMSRPIVSVVGRKLGFKFLAAEAWWILTGRNDVESIAPYSSHIASFSNDGHRFDGAYGPRVVDQLRYVVDTLVADPDTRQAAIEIWRPNPRESKDVPCTLVVQWLLRDGKLHCVDTMRSSDAWLGWPYDVFNFSMLSAYVALRLREVGWKNPQGGPDSSKWERLRRLELGTLWLTAGSSHLYVHPKEDGARNVPYSFDDVERIATGANQAKPYAPLCLDEFDSPRHLIEHLSLCKDKLGVMNWMKEFQL